MKSYHFPLQSLQVLREQKERNAQKRYAGALRASNEAAARLDAATRELDAAWTALHEEVADNITAAKLHQTRAWCGELERRCEQLSAALKLSERLTREAWHEMLLATRDREALDRLREKSRRAFDREIRRDEQKQLDEMGLRLNLPPVPRNETVTTQMA
jgi:flagellar FliJ protein